MSSWLQRLFRIKLHTGIIGRVTKCDPDYEKYGGPSVKPSHFPGMISAIALDIYSDGTYEFEHDDKKFKGTWVATE